MTKAEKLAAQLLAAHGGTVTPVPVEAIAQALGIRVARVKHDGTQTSFTARSAEGEIVIGLNVSRGIRSQRFAAAHALGHALLQPDRELVVCHEYRTDYAADFRAEYAATQFAAYLTMPRDAVFEHARKVMPDGRPSRTDFVVEMASRFGVSQAAMAFRLVDLAILTP